MTIDKNNNRKTLIDYSMNWNQKQFDYRNIYIPIAELTLEDYNWCLRNRFFLNQIIDLTIYKIEKNWDEVNQYYSSELCQWYDDAIKEIITIPFEFWACRVDAFQKIRYFIKSSTNRKFAIESSFIKLFINHSPKPKSWTIDDSNMFLNNLSYGSGMGIAGNLIAAFEQVKEIKYAILYGQSIYVESVSLSISNEEELYMIFRTEYSGFGKLVEEFIIEPLKKERILEL